MKTLAFMGLTFTPEQVEALRTLDLRPFLAMGASEAVARIAIHKVRYECFAVEPALREESREWLEKAGVGRFRGLPWPPKGVLPDDGPTISLINGETLQ